VFKIMHTNIRLKTPVILVHYILNSLFTSTLCWLSSLFSWY